MTLPKLRDLGTIFLGGSPGQVVIQITNYCNASCPQCGMRKSTAMERFHLHESRVKYILDQCARNRINAVSLTGGEPFINMAAIVDFLDYGTRLGIRYLRSGTNGYMLAPGGKAAEAEDINRFAKTLSRTGIRNFWISLDSADTQTHEIMRGLPGVIEGIRRALPFFHAQGLYPAANLGINRNVAGPPIPALAGPYDEERFLNAFTAGFTAFFSRTVDLGFTMANVCYPMSSAQAGLSDERPVYGAISADAAVDFSPAELRLVFRALLEVIPRFRKRIRIFSPLSVLYAMSRGDEALMFPCLGGYAYFFVGCKDGRLYPCGYRGNEDLGKDFTGAIRQGRKIKPFCLKCHWECFRDPSQLFGLARYMIRHPAGCFVKKRIDPRMVKLWFADMGYYIRNDFFNGRKSGGKQGRR